MTDLKNKKNSVKWDMSHSTYYWKIYLDKSSPLNSTNVEYLQGYSKQERQREANDKIHLLKSKILNLHKNGYFDRIERIDFYIRIGDVINQSQDEKLFKMFPLTCVFNPNYSEYIEKHFMKFIKDFYDRRYNNESMEGLLEVKRKVISDDDRLNIHRVSLNNMQQLLSYGSRLLINGHPEGAVMNFIDKYKELKKW